ncbi:hypothetical protein N7G274_001273 [Stereocaulon virgatum]|uniref:NACHT domain-containing protein n=1 Tax=Stereocaulon virgatum TaxID=373712 RepID=A0ABR4ARH3_9LECA
MDGLSAAASVISVVDIAAKVYSLCQNYILGVRHARQDILRLSTEVWAFREIVERVEELVQSPGALKLSTLALLDANGPMKQCAQQLSVVLEKLEPNEDMQRTGWRALKWPLKSEKVDQIIHDLERYKSTFSLALSTDQAALSIAVDAGVTQLRQDFAIARVEDRHQAALTETVNESVGQLAEDFASSRGEKRQMQMDQRRKEIIAWLSKTDPSINHVNQRKKHQATTGDWFLKVSEFLTWSTTSNSFLWLYGAAGCGKTVLSSAIIEHLKESVRSKYRSAIGYFYFDFNDREKQRAFNFLISIAAQICSQVPEFPHEMDKLNESCHRGTHMPVLKDLQVAFNLVLKDLDDAYVVVDAMDECPKEGEERECLLAMINQLYKSSPKSLHLLATSRREYDIETTFGSLLTPAICIENSRLDSDIKLYVQSELKVVGAGKNWSDDLKAEVESTLTQQANGMFRWVFCQLDALKSCLKPSLVRQKLRMLPKDLLGTYSRILENVHEDYRNDAYNALRWLAFAGRPLKLSELIESLLVDPENDPPFNSEDRLSDPHAILEILPGLISISSGVEDVYRDEDNDHRDEDSERIRLAHFSVKEFITDGHLLSGPTANFGMMLNGSHHFITKACLAYILYYEQSENRHCTRADLELFPLLHYACQYWYRHKTISNQEGVSSSDGSVNKALLKIFVSSSTDHTWLQVHRPDDEYERPFHGHSIYPLYFAAWWGLEDIVERLLDKGVDVNSTDHKFENPLSAAAHQGHERTCLLLLCGGADVNYGRDTGFAGTALQSAAYGGHESVVKLLLENGADVDIGVNLGSPALHQATRACATSIMKLLLDDGAAVEATDQQGETPLHHAASRGYKPAIQLLLDRGAAIEAKDRQGRRTPLHYAALRGHEPAIQLLLDRGAAVEAKDRQGRTPLHRVAIGGHETAIQLLLDRGAAVEAKDKQGETPLHRAAVGGHEPAMRLLLDRGAAAEAKDQQGETPLHRVAIGGHEPVIQLLLDRGAAAEAKDQQGETPLHRVAIGGHEPAIQLLLDRGAAVEATDQQGETPLHRAAVGGHEPAIQLLLDRGAAVEAKDKQGETPLHRAAVGVHEPAIRLLLDRGAAAEAKDQQGRTPLHRAAIGRSKPAIQLLLDRGAAAEAKDEQGETPLHHAAKVCDEAIICTLLQRGADATASNNEGCRPVEILKNSRMFKILVSDGKTHETQNIEVLLTPS